MLHLQDTLTPSTPHPYFRVHETIQEYSTFGFLTIVAETSRKVFSPVATKTRSSRSNYRRRRRRLQSLPVDWRKIFWHDLMGPLYNKLQTGEFRSWIASVETPPPQMGKVARHSDSEPLHLHVVVDLAPDHFPRKLSGSQIENRLQTYWANVARVDYRPGTNDSRSFHTLGDYVTKHNKEADMLVHDLLGPKASRIIYSSSLDLISSVGPHLADGSVPSELR